MVAPPHLLDRAMIAFTNSSRARARVFSTRFQAATDCPSIRRDLSPLVLRMALLLAVGMAGWVAGLEAQPPRSLPQGQMPEDVRLQPLKDLDGYFPFQPPATREAWAKRAERVRRQVQVTLGLWPEPARTQLNAVVHGRLEREGFTVEKVCFESLPGFWVTGNLYRPVGRSGRVPAVLCPHGHWNEGRFMDQGEAGVRREIAQGAERFEGGGRSVLQARCVQLARMGCVVFHYDMLGYADSQQIPMEIAHGFRTQRPEMNTPENWGLFSPRAESHYQSVMGLQTWNSIRALDFVAGLPDVDPERIACTGASGGGTQTFILGALDARVRVGFPAVMVSTAMQGGCTCENACGLRVATGNVELAALFAPKPQGLTSADDWTREMSTKGFPELQQVYALFDARDMVMLKRGEHFGHNYNHVSRTAMYAWMNRHLKLGLPEPVLERDFTRLHRAEMSVWDDAHPAPSGGPEFERRLLRWWTDDADRKVRAAQAKPEAFRDLAGPAVEVVMGRTLAEVGPVEFQATTRQDHGGWSLTAGVLRVSRHQEALPALLLAPPQPSGDVVVWVDEAGKQGLYDGDGQSPRAEVRRLLEAGRTVVSADLLFQGEFVAEGASPAKTRRVKNPRESAAYTFGYNHALFAQRAHDVLALVAFAREQAKGRPVDLVGLGGAGPWVAAARTQTGEAVRRTALDTQGFRFIQVADLHAVNFLPGGAKYGDLPGMLMLGAPGRLWLAGEPADGVAAVRAFYASAGQESALTVDASDPAGRPDRAVAWLLRKDGN